MDLELVTVGTELLLGFTVDTNAAEISRALATVGARVVRRVTVGDDPAPLRDAVAGALRRSRFVVITGGLGPTSDDITRRTVAELFRLPLDLDEGYVRELEERFRRYRHQEMPPSNRSQAEVPRGAVRLHNRRGTAPGLVIDGPLGTAVLLPGVPGEMRQILHDHVVPLVRQRVRSGAGRSATIRSRTLRTTGVTESGLADLVGPMEANLDGATLAYLPGWDGVDLRLTVWGMDESAADRALDGAARKLIRMLGDRYYGVDDDDLGAAVLGALRAAGKRVAVAESCTGGLVCGRLSAVPGASDVFAGGVIAYANAAKVAELGVRPEVLEREGAVSEAVARSMAEGAVRRFGTDAAVAVTGIAGPAGGTPEKPVGTVWLAATAGGRTEALQRRFPGGRDEVRHRSAQAALDLLRRLLTGDLASAADPAT
jgi:nicotinamide-nucleotide amidase